MVNDDRFIDDTLKSDDLQEDTFNEDHNSMFSGDEQMKRSSARKHRMVPDAGKGILWTLTGLALDHFQFAAGFAELTASLGYDLSSYYTPDLL